MSPWFRAGLQSGKYVKSYLWPYNGFPPKFFVDEIFKRATRKSIAFEKIEPLIWAACKKYSGNPFRTFSAFEVFRNHFVVDGEIDFRLHGIHKGKTAKETHEYLIDIAIYSGNKVSDIKTKEEIKENEYKKSELIYCERCGTIEKGNKEKQTGVAERWDCMFRIKKSRQKKEVYWPMRLCVPCWNKLKPIAKKAKEAEEIRILTGRLYRAKKENYHVEN